MNSITIISIAIAIAACIALIVLVKTIKRKKTQKKFHALSDYAAKHDCKISKHEFFDGISIGLDETSNYLFFMKQHYDKKTEQHIDLSKIQNCRVNNISRMVNGVVAIDKLELCFSPSAKDVPQLIMEFYNSDYDSVTLAGEVQFIEKWAEIVQNKLKK
jgi:hypothetical protein